MVLALILCVEDVDINYIFVLLTVSIILVLLNFNLISFSTIIFVLTYLSFSGILCVALGYDILGLVVFLMEPSTTRDEVIVNIIINIKGIHLKDKPGFIKRMFFYILCVAGLRIFVCSITSVILADVIYFSAIDYINTVFSTSVFNTIVDGEYMMYITDSIQNCISPLFTLNTAELMQDYSINYVFSSYTDEYNFDYMSSGRSTYYDPVKDAANDQINDNSGGPGKGGGKKNGGGKGIDGYTGKANKITHSEELAQHLRTTYFYGGRQLFEGGIYFDTMYANTTEQDHLCRIAIAMRRQNPY